MNQSHWNVNWNCNALLQNNKLSFNAIAAKMAKKNVETCKWPRTDGQRPNIIRPVLRQAYSKWHRFVSYVLKLLFIKYAKLCYTLMRKKNQFNNNKNLLWPNHHHYTCITLACVNNTRVSLFNALLWYVQVKHLI